MEIMPLLHAIKHLSQLVEGLSDKIVNMQLQIDEMQEEWREEYSVSNDDSDEDSGDEVSSEEDHELVLLHLEEEVQRSQSAPATFSYKVQRTE